MDKTIIGLFPTVDSAIQATKEMFPELGSEQISLVSQGDPQAFNQLNGYVQHVTSHTNDLGTVNMAGPIGHDLKGGDKSLSSYLAYMGVNHHEAIDIQHKLKNGNVLAVIQTDNSKINEMANLMKNYGAVNVTKWDKDLDHPQYPYG